MSLIKKFNAHVSRNKGDVANEVYVYITILSQFSNVEIKAFEVKDLRNLNEEKDVAGVLNLDVHILRKEGAIVLKKPTLIYKVFEFNTNELDFRFNEKNDFIFLINVITNEKPTGTKRTVITYEDTDVIDDTL
ncbi:hypothetical protein [uncultured Kordia sp.]|uniref:hypothetical protein n=1 Tax=uncultured Kordia sp. TaxID=507699 RepID=UPI0026251206|nr:hypothetical protein [uncultured Kordia sp.]